MSNAEIGAIAGIMIVVWIAMVVTTIHLAARPAVDYDRVICQIHRCKVV